jgi:cytochrome P450
MSTVLATTSGLDERLANLLTGDAEAVKNPYLLYADLRKEGPVYWYKGRIPFVTTYAAAVTLFRDNGRFLTYRGKERFGYDRLSAEDQKRVDDICAFELMQMNEMNGEAHRRVRSAAQRAFPPNRIVDMARHAVRYANDLLDEMIATDSPNFMRFAYQLPLSVITELIGMDREDIDRLKEWGDDIASTKPYAEGNIPLANIRKAHESVQKTKDYVRDMVERHRKHPDRTPFMAALLDAESQDRLSPDELAGTISIIIYAAHEATSNLIGNGLSTFLIHRDQWVKLCADQSLSRKAVSETLRYNPPVHMMTRLASEDIEFEGERFPKGTRPIILYGSANRDGAEFTNPDVFDISRERSNHLGFGHGIHVCIGSRLAELEGQMVFETMARRFPDVELAEDPAQFEWKRHPVFHGLKRLNIKLGPDRGRTIP